MTIDLDGLAREVEEDGRVVAVIQQYAGISHEDAEDALQEAFVRLHARATRIDAAGNLRGYLFRVALNCARSERARRARRVDFAALSLDEFDDGGDFLHGGTTDTAVVDAKLELDRLMNHPVGRQLVAAALVGGDGVVRARGTAHRNGHYSDEVATEVRRLRAEGVDPREIATRLDVSEAFAKAINRDRLLATTEGWTAALVVAALRAFAAEHGRAPRLKDTKGNPLMPGQNTVSRFFGTWNGGLRAAGLDAAEATAWKNRVARWNEENVVAALRAFAKNNGRPAKASDLTKLRGRRAELYPGLSTVQRLYGSLHDANKAAGVLPRELMDDSLSEGERGALTSLLRGEKLSLGSDAVGALGAVFGRTAKQPWEVATACG